VRTLAYHQNVCFKKLGPTIFTTILHAELARVRLATQCELRNLAIPLSLLRQPPCLRRILRLPAEEAFGFGVGEDALGHVRVDVEDLKG